LIKSALSRPWLTLPGAAKYLSDQGIGDGTEAFILRQGLDKRIKLSVKLTKPIWANPCQWVFYDAENLKAARSNKIYPDELKWHETTDGPKLASLYLGDNKFLNIQDKEWISVGGVWDLPMVDGDWMEIEQKWRSLTGASRDSRRVMYGVFLEGDDGAVCRLKDLFNVSEYQAAHKERLREQQRQNAANNLSKENSELLLKLIEDERESFLKKRLRIKEFSLPEDSSFVVRTDALIGFEKNERLNITKSNVMTGIVKDPCAPALPANKLDADKDGLKQKRQEYEVLRIIRDELKLDPLNLPYRKPGKSGSKAEVRAHLKIPGELFQSDGTFEGAWERLRALGQLQGGK
jgi:hypothetical protein